LLQFLGGRLLRNAKALLVPNDASTISDAATIQQKDESPLHLIEVAAGDLCPAKESGRNRIVTHEPEHSID
jgi:hypothetical protein